MKKVQKRAKKSNLKTSHAYKYLYLVSIGLRQAVISVKIDHDKKAKFYNSASLRFFYDDKNLKKVFKRDAKRAEKILCDQIAKDFNFDVLVDA